ncbi:hypothetical protein HMPREF9413_2764 [Paenibacillus sp. HGF7]|nr:hypothetical protein HMPREF9413_2764 [Paenibacillus sp. HGF7]
MKLILTDDSLPKPLFNSPKRKGIFGEKTKVPRLYSAFGVEWS